MQRSLLEVIHLNKLNTIADQYHHMSLKENRGGSLTTKLT